MQQGGLEKALRGLGMFTGDEPGVVDSMAAERGIHRTNLWASSRNRDLDRPTRAARETRRRLGTSLSRSDGEPAQALLLPGCTAYESDQARSRCRTHQGVTVGVGSEAVQDAIGSTEVARHLLG